MCQDIISRCVPNIKTDYKNLVFSFRLLRRLVTLISKLAVLEASHEAVVKQAKGATEQCRKLLDENEELKVRNYMLFMM